MLFQAIHNRLHDSADGSSLYPSFLSRAIPFGIASLHAFCSDKPATVLGSKVATIFLFPLKYLGSYSNFSPFSRTGSPPHPTKIEFLVGWAGEPARKRLIENEARYRLLAAADSISRAPTHLTRINAVNGDRLSTSLTIDPGAIDRR